MKIFQNHKIVFSLLLLLVTLSITLFVVYDTLTINVEHKYESYTLDTNKTIFENLQSIPEFSIFLNDTIRTGNAALLQDESKHLVILIPTNEAYFNIDSTTRAKLEEPGSMHKLEKIIAFHIFELPSLTSFSNATEVRSINGQSVRISLENGVTMIRDAVGNTFTFEKVFYPSSNGYFAKVSQVLLPFNISSYNGSKIEADKDINENVGTFAGPDKFNGEQKKHLLLDNITFLYSDSLNTESNIKDNILVGTFNTYQLSLLENVTTLSGSELLIDSSENSIIVGDIVIDRSNSNLESKNGFIHIGF